MVFKNLEECYVERIDVSGMTVIFPGMPDCTAMIDSVDERAAHTSVGRIPREGYKGILVCLKPKTGTSYPRV